MALTFDYGKTLLQPTISICSVCQRPQTTTFGLGRSCLYGACRPLRHYWTILRQHPRLNDVGIVIILRFVYNHADRVRLYYQPQTWGERWLKALAETVTDVDCRNPYSMMQAGGVDGLWFSREYLGPCYFDPGRTACIQWLNNQRPLRSCPELSALRRPPEHCSLGDLPGMSLASWQSVHRYWPLSDGGDGIPYNIIEACAWFMQQGYTRDEALYFWESNMLPPLSPLSRTSRLAPSVTC